MAKKMVALRCPPQLLQKLTDLAQSQGKTRTRVMIEAVRLFTRTVQARGGRVVPPYDGSELLADMDFGGPIPRERKSTKKSSTK